MEKYNLSENGIQKSIKDIAKKKANSWGISPLDKYINDIDKIKIISAKCGAGKHKFIPYNLKLVLKGRGKAPREISIPAPLDQAVLKSLDQSLKLACPISNQTKLATFIISHLKNFLQHNKNNTELCVKRLDIKDFFPKINHAILSNKLKKKTCPDWLEGLTIKAIKTPSKEQHEKSSALNTIGVPQGIAIASYLADLYLENFDICMSKACLQYYRYVDDILIIYLPQQKENIKNILTEELERKLALEYHTKDKSKFYDGPLHSQEGFGFLGYVFSITQQEVKTSIREESVQKFLNSLIDLIIKLRKGGYDQKYVDTQKSDAAFLFDINEKITGAHKNEKRYGWLWYFKQMDDLPLLDRIDRILSKEMSKDARTRKLRIKRMKRSYYEIINFRNSNNYILNYGLVDPQKIQQLYGGIYSPIKNAITDEKILASYNAFVNQRVKKLQLDEIDAY